VKSPLIHITIIAEVWLTVDFVQLPLTADGVETLSNVFLVSKPNVYAQTFVPHHGYFHWISAILLNLVK